MNKIKSWIEYVKALPRKFLIIQEGGKERLNTWNAAFIIAITIGLLFVINWLAAEEEDTSYSNESNQNIISKGDLAGGSQNAGSRETNYKFSKAKPHHSRSNAPAIQNLNLEGRQLIVRTEADISKSIPIGSSLIGKLLTGIDSRRDGGFVKVLLPYGGSFKNMGSIPKNTTLLGNANYPGKGEKVYITFTRGVTSDGREFEISAEALSPKDYSPGIPGTLHSNVDVRVLSTTALSAISVMGDILTEKEPNGSEGNMIEKATMRNALLKGASKAAQMEANREASALAKEKDYVTVESGSALIVGLTSTMGEIK